MAEHIKPVDFRVDREPDWQYHELLDDIMRDGELVGSAMAEKSKELLGRSLRFNFVDNGFPLITERDISRAATPVNIENHSTDLEQRPLSGPVKQAMAEICAFINGARTQEELVEFGCTHFWKPWTEGEEAEAKATKRGLAVGDLGSGSYGAAFHDFPTTEGKPFNQIKHIIEQINERPELRTHILTPFIPQYIGRGEGKQQKVIIVPCHGLVHFLVNTESRELKLVHWQRSADVPIGLPFNLVHYAALAMMVGQVTQTKPVELIHQISTAHIYEQHFEDVEDLLERDPRSFPILKIDPSVTNIFDFRPEHFSIEQYDPHPPKKMAGPSI